MRYRTIVPVLALSGLAALPASSGPVYENKSGGTFSFYGRFSPAWVHFDDGDDSQGKLGDNDAATSLLGFNLIQPFGENALKFNFETATGFRGTSAISQLDDAKAYHWNREKLRFVDFSYKMPRYGTVYLGQGSQATDNTANINLGSVGPSIGLSIGDWTGAYFLRQKDGTLSDVTVKQAFPNYDGNRLGRIRYDSPEYRGFSFRTSYGRNILVSEDDSDYWDMVVVYDKEFTSGIKFKGALGYSVTDRKDGKSDLKNRFTSAAVLLPSGFNASLGIGDREDGGDYYYGQVGYTANWIDWGITSMGIDYYKGSDMVTDGDDSKSWGVGVLQNIAAYHTDLYAGYRKYEYDSDVNNFEDASSYVIGTRFTF